MAERPINIWGKPYCELPNGGNCDACCSVLGFEDPTFGKNGFNKEIGVACKLQGSVNGKEVGCGIHPFHPEPCGRYHCNTSPTETKLLLVDEAQKLELVSSAEAQAAIDRLSNNLTSD